MALLWDESAVLVDHTTASAGIARELEEEARSAVRFHRCSGVGRRGRREERRADGHVRRRWRPMHEAEKVIAAYAHACTLWASRAAGNSPNREPDLHRGPCTGPVRRPALSTGRPRCQDLVAAISKGAAQCWSWRAAIRRWPPAVDFGFAVDWMARTSTSAWTRKKQRRLLPVSALVDQFYSQIEKMIGPLGHSSSIALLQR